MDSYEIAKPYAEALVALGEDTNKLVELEEEVHDFGELFFQVENFRIFLEAPHLSSEDKKNLLNKLFQNKISEIFLNFLCFLADKRRFLVFPEILKEFASLIAKREGRIRVKVYTARELDSSLAEKITQTLEKKTGRKVQVKYRVRPEILGGIVLKIEETKVDGSLKHRLEDWKKVLMEK